MDLLSDLKQLELLVDADLEQEEMKSVPADSSNYASAEEGDNVSMDVGSSTAPTPNKQQDKQQTERGSATQMLGRMNVSSSTKGASGSGTPVQETEEDSEEEDINAPQYSAQFDPVRKKARHIDEYQLLNEIGKGTYGTVRRARDHKENRYVTIVSIKLLFVF